MPKEPMFFSDEEKARITDEALERLSNGQSLLSYANEKGINRTTIYNWLVALGDGDNSPYARAKLAGTHALAEECLDIADDATGDLTVDGEGNERTNTEVVQRAKLRIDTRLRLIGKWNRKDYGDKVDGEQTVKHEMSDEMKSWLDQR
jgi:transposase-like protein